MSTSPSSSILCAADKCELASLALCQCCKKDLCIDHLNEHANQRNEKLLPVIDKINVLLNRFNHLSTGEQTGWKQVDQWKQNAYKIIDGFCEKKQADLFGETVDQQREQLNEMHSKLTELIRKKGGTQQDLEVFAENMKSIEQFLDKLEQTQVTLPPLTINDDCILRPVDSIEKSSEKPSKSRKKSSEKSSKRKKKSSRHSDDSSDRSSHHRSRSPRNHTSRSSRRRRDRSSNSDSSRSSNTKKADCDDCHGCRFYQDRFGPGFMDDFGPCSCDCHKWAYS